MFTFVPSGRLLYGRVNVVRSPGNRFNILIDETCGVDPEVLSSLQPEVERAAREWAKMRPPGIVPLVGCHIEDLQDRLVEAELSPLLVSIYLRRGTMGQDVATELASGIQYMMRHL